MIQGDFLVVPLAADGKIAFGRPTVGVRVRLLGTEFQETLMDSTVPFADLVSQAKSRILEAAVSANIQFPSRIGRLRDNS